MEVLYGNLSGSKHSRRRSDQFTIGDNRSLDWGIRDSDITLIAYSPLSMAEVLSDRGGVLDLIPQEKQIEDQPNNGSLQRVNTTRIENVEPFNTSTSQRSNDVDTGCTREEDPESLVRCNLQTQHTRAELLSQCRKILVENALVKSKGERQFYLAAGFLSWPDTTQSKQRKRAPLLLYPALLVRVPNQTRYEVRITGETPEFNQTLVEHIGQRFATTLPDYHADKDLKRYYSSVANALKKTPNLMLEYEVALGSAALFQHNEIDDTQVDLPDIPKNFNVGLAMSITGNKSLMQLHAVLQLIPNYTQGGSEADTKPTYIPSSESVASLRQYAARLAAEGLDHIEFKQLGMLPSMIKKWTDDVNQGLLTTTIDQVLNKPELSARELIRLAGIIELIDKAPVSIDTLAHADLCYKNSTLLLQRAQHQAKLIEDELSALQEYFFLDKIPSKAQLLSLISELGGTLEQDPDLVGADYFNARRQFMEFSVHKPSHLNQEHRRLLSQLAKVIRFRELFVNNTEYRAALGPAYKGLRTDWATLVQVSTYSRELAEVLESTTLAGLVLSNWATFRRQYGTELDALQSAADSCRRLLKVVGTRWQSQPVSDLVNHALLIRSRLKEWRKAFGSTEHHADKSASTVLSSFSGKSREDVMVETHVDETRSRLDEQLLSGEINHQQIQETLAWLKAASSTASENDMTIEAIVEHLQIA